MYGAVPPYASTSSWHGA